MPHKHDTGIKIRLPNYEVKRNTEQGAAMHLLKKFGLRPNSQEVIWCEGPDYYFILKGRTIGVEIVQCIPSKFESEGKMNNVARRKRETAIFKTIAKSLENDGFFGFEIHIQLGDEIYEKFAIQKTNTKKIQLEAVTEITKRIKEFLLIHPNGDIFENYESDKYMNRIVIFEKLPNLNKVHVLPSARGAFLLNINPEPVLKCIKDKEQKLKDYHRKERFDEFWLQIHVPYGENYTVQSVKLNDIKSGFDRIYITSHCGDCVQLK